jgi:6-phosphogluconolactonase (cycloisomerase 2 family)
VAPALTRGLAAQAPSTARALLASVGTYSSPPVDTPPGKVDLPPEEWTRGSYPRSFALDPTGQFLYVCNQRGDAVTTFRVDRATGRLTFTGQYTPVGSPSMIAFLDPGRG